MKRRMKDTLSDNVDSLGNNLLVHRVHQLSHLCKFFCKTIFLSLRFSKVINIRKSTIIEENTSSQQCKCDLVHLAVPYVGQT